MESLSTILSSSPPLLNHTETPKSSSSKPPFLSSKSLQIHSLSPRSAHLSNFHKILLKPHLPILGTSLFHPIPCFAIEELPNKINLEAIVVSIDDFFNKNPFFVAGVTFIWLVVIPLAEEYFQKYKFVSAIDAFRKLRDEPNFQMIDIRDRKSLAFLKSPNLKIINKGVLQVEFREGDEDGFVAKVLENLKEPADTTVCILDNFDGNSMKVAELLVKNGFKEAYAIRGGIRGKKGWQDIQENLLPPSVHIYPKQKAKKGEQQDSKDQPNGDKDQASFGKASEDTSNGYIKSSSEPTSQARSGHRSSSPYPNYPDLKPPSSPTPSKPQSLG